MESPSENSIYERSVNTLDDKEARVSKMLVYMPNEYRMDSLTETANDHFQKILMELFTTEVRAESDTFRTSSSHRNQRGRSSVCAEDVESL